MSDAPRLFFSYSHDDEAHKNWVLNLATRLVNNGVDVVLDQWDTQLGDDLPSFMESLVEANRVLAICSANYIEKANYGAGGTGYEKRLLSDQLMKDINTNQIIPVIYNNDTDCLVPTFLSGQLYVDFRDHETFEARYAELLRTIHGQPVVPRPPLGSNPFTQEIPEIEPCLSFAPERYISPALSGTVTFDYSNNSGRYALGAGDMLFETAWSGGDSTSIYAYSDPPSIRSVALATEISQISEIEDARMFDTSSRVRSPHLNEIVVWQNTAGYYLATKIMGLKSRSHDQQMDEVIFAYVIAPNKSIHFTAV